MYSYVMCVYYYVVYRPLCYIFQLVAEIWLTGTAPFVTKSQRFLKYYNDGKIINNFNLIKFSILISILCPCGLGYMS